MPGFVFEDDSSRFNMAGGRAEPRRPPVNPETARALGVAALVGAVYVATMSRSPGWWDAPERIVAAIQLGFSHPPGAPFHALAGNGFSLVAGFLRPEVALNLFSALCGAAAAAFCYRLARVFAGGVDWKLSALAALATAFSAVVWAECLHAEVYALHWLLWCAFLFHFARWSQRAGGGLRDLAMAAFLFALAFSTHAGTALFAAFLPAVVLAKRPEVVRDPRGLAVVAAATAIGLTPYLLLPLRADSYDFMGARHRPEGWDNFLAYISGAQFNSTAYMRGWWPGEMFKRSAHLGMFAGYSMAGFGCLAPLAALHRLLRWRLFAAALAAGATLFAAFRFLPMEGLAAKESGGAASGVEIATHLLLYLWPGLAAGIAARVHRAWIGSAVGACGLYAFYFGSNQTSEFYAMITPLWAFLPMILAMGLGQPPVEPAAAPLPAPGPIARRAKPILFGAVAAQLVLFPAISAWGVSIRPFDGPLHAALGTPGWKLALAKVGARKNCWRLDDGGQRAEIDRLERTLRRFNRALAYVVVRWEVQTALEFYRRVERRFANTQVVEYMKERRWYRVRGEPAFVDDPDNDALDLYQRHNVFYLVGDPPAPEWSTPFELARVDRFFFDDHWYALYAATGLRAEP